MYTKLTSFLKFRLSGKVDIHFNKVKSKDEKSKQYIYCCVMSPWEFLKIKGNRTRIYNTKKNKTTGPWSTTTTKSLVFF